MHRRRRLLAPPPPRPAPAAAASCPRPQATFNLLDQSAGPALQRAHEAGLFVIIKEAVANGRLVQARHRPARVASLKLAIPPFPLPPNPTATSSPSPGRVQGAPPPLRDEAAARGVGVDALALAWVLSHPWVGMCLSGAATPEHVRANAAARALAPLPEEARARLGDALRVECEAYWAERRALAWN